MISIAQSRDVQHAPRVRNVYDETYFGLTVLMIDGKEYAVGTLEQAEMAAREIAKECFDLVDIDLLMRFTFLPPEAIVLVRCILNGCYEDIEVLAEVIPDLDMMAEVAVKTQGRLHFLKLWEREFCEYPLSTLPDSYTQPILREMGLAPTDKESIYLYPVR